MTLRRFPEDIYLSISLMKKHGSLCSRDAVIIASMLNNGINNIISADKDFDGIDKIRRIDPVDR